MWAEFQHFDRVGKVPRSQQAASCQDCAGVDAEGAEGTSIISTYHRIQVLFFWAALFTDGNMLKLHKIGSSRVKHVIPGLVFWNLRRIFHGFSPSCSIICPSCFHIFHYLSIIAPSFSIIVPLFFPACVSIICPSLSIHLCDFVPHSTVTLRKCQRMVQAATDRWA